MCKVNVKTVYYNMRAYIQDDILHIIAVKEERVLQNNIFVDFMPLEVICMSVTIALLTITAIYMRSVSSKMTYDNLYTPMFKNTLSMITLHMT